MHQFRRRRCLRAAVARVAACRRRGQHALRIPPRVRAARFLQPLSPRAEDPAVAMACTADPGAGLAHVAMDPARAWGEHARPPLLLLRRPLGRPHEPAPAPHGHPPLPLLLGRARAARACSGLRRIRRGQGASPATKKKGEEQGGARRRAGDQRPATSGGLRLKWRRQRRTEPQRREKGDRAQERDREREKREREGGGIGRTTETEREIREREKEGATGPHVSLRNKQNDAKCTSNTHTESCF
uniref:Uncharacterized protein n=1 Tax=Arundo donax TaxID=35708 RepID=A0A0A9H0H6_ARUDO